MPSGSSVTQDRCKQCKAVLCGLRHMRYCGKKLPGGNRVSLCPSEEVIVDLYKEEALSVTLSDTTCRPLNVSISLTPAAGQDSDQYSSFCHLYRFYIFLEEAIYIQCYSIQSNPVQPKLIQPNQIQPNPIPTINLFSLNPLTLTVYTILF